MLYQDGLVVEACHKVGATVLVRGIRNTVDFEYEKNMAGMNALIDPALIRSAFIQEKIWRFVPVRMFVNL